MKYGLLGYKTGLGKRLLSLWIARGETVITFGRPEFDLKEHSIGERLGSEFNGDILVLNAFSYDDELAQGRCLEQLLHCSNMKEKTIVVIGSTAWCFNSRPMNTSHHAEFLRYQAGKRYLHDIAFTHYGHNNQCSLPKLILLQPNVIGINNADRPFLIPEDIDKMLQAALNLPAAFIELSIVGANYE